MMTMLRNNVLAALVAGGAALIMAQTSAFADDDRVEYGDLPCSNMGYGMGQRMGFGMGQRGRGRGATLRFQAIDQNSDGLINDDEAAANAEAVFVAMDADDSGEITEAEYMSVRMGPGQGRNKARQNAMQERKKARFPQMDTDGNKQVSQAEFLAAAQARFAAADLNDDGAVTPWEFRAHRRFF